MDVKTHIYCKNPNCNKLFKRYSTIQKFCSQKCEIEVKGRKEIKPKKPINPVSKKQAVENAKYTVIRFEYLARPENKYCQVKGSHCTKIANTVEHRRGRKGFADDWAREHNITLQNDVRFFMPSCNCCNYELENNPELSKEHQLSKIHGGKKF